MMSEKKRSKKKKYESVFCLPVDDDQITIRHKHNTRKERKREREHFVQFPEQIHSVKSISSRCHSSPFYIPCVIMCFARSSPDTHTSCSWDIVDIWSQNEKWKNTMMTVTVTVAVAVATVVRAHGMVDFKRYFYLPSKKICWLIQLSHVCQ